jgi:SAM-dependent methyltransferase
MSQGNARASVDWDRRYAGADYLFGTNPNRFLASCGHLLNEGDRALCIADGEGRNSVWLAGRGLEVDAFDLSPVGVAKARRLAESRGVTVRFEVASAEAWDWPTDAYDIVVAIFIQFAPPAMRRKIFSRVAHALRPGGLLLLEGYRTEQLAYGTGGPPVADQMYSEEQLGDELSELSIERMESYDAVVDEGPAHSGLSALIDVVARRDDGARHGAG